MFTSRMTPTSRNIAYSVHVRPTDVSSAESNLSVSARPNRDHARCLALPHQLNKNKTMYDYGNKMVWSRECVTVTKSTCDTQENDLEGNYGTRECVTKNMEDIEITTIQCVTRVLAGFSSACEMGKRSQIHRTISPSKTERKWRRSYKNEQSLCWVQSSETSYGGDELSD